MKLSWISEVVECWYDYEVVCLTISREVRCGSGGRITARSSLVKAPVEIIPSVLSKTTQRLTVEVTVNWNGWRITDLRSWFKYSWNWLCTKFGRHKVRVWVGERGATVLLARDVLWPLHTVPFPYQLRSNTPKNVISFIFSQKRK